MTDDSLSRRNALKALGATAATASFAGCSALQGKSKLEKELATVREATKKYDGNVEKAMEDGYNAIQGPFIPGMGWHFSNPDLLKKAAKEGPSLEEPPMLVYDMEGNLGGVEWGIPNPALDTTPDLFSDSNSNATEKWGEHTSATHIFAKPDGQQTAPENISTDDLLNPAFWAEVAPPAKDIQAGDKVRVEWGKFVEKQTLGNEEHEERVVDKVFTHPGLTTMHAWVHVENPSGVFSPVNPDFAQR